MGEGASSGSGGAKELKSCLGGEFLLLEVGTYPIFTPEDFSEEQKMYFDTADDFSRNEVVPRVKEIEEKKPGLMVDLLRKARAKFDVLKEEQVPIFASGMGSPAFILDELHDAGIKVWGLIWLARQARRELEQGLDLIIAQGQDSGGHTGRMGTFSLVREVSEIAKEHDTPILAAGGVTTGEHIVAALALGAVGVWCGTIWQSTDESDVAAHLKRRLIEAATEDSVQSRASTGKRASMLRSRWTESWSTPEAPEPLKMPLQGMLVAKIQQAIDDWNVEDFQTVAAGQGVGFVREIKPTRQVVLDVMNEAYDVIDNMQLGEPASP